MTANLRVLMYVHQLALTAGSAGYLWCIICMYVYKPCLDSWIFTKFPPLTAGLLGVGGECVNVYQMAGFCRL